MNLELLCRQAIDRIKSEWGLPLRGFVAGGSIANIVWELVSGNKAVVNDIDIFIFDGFQPISDNYKKNSLFSFQEKSVRYFEDYTGMCFQTYTKDFYSIVESTREDVFNVIKYKSNSSDPALIIKSFDINATQVGYNIEEDKFYWTKEFEEFLSTGKLKVCNLMTPSHTAIRISKKRIDLNVSLDEFEIKLLQYALNYHFNDRIKLRFRDRYYNLFQNDSEFLSQYFELDRDLEAEEYVLLNHNESVELWYLKPVGTKFVDKVVDFDGSFLNTELNLRSGSYFFGDSLIDIIFISTDFLFYMRNIYGNETLKNIWKDLNYFFYDGYVDKQVSQEELELLIRFSKYAPNSIEKLKGLKLSEQLDIINKFLEAFKEDPYVAISILESVKVDKNIQLDEQTKLILELSVRKNIVNDTRNKVSKILKIVESKTDTEEDIDIDF